MSDEKITLNRHPRALSSIARWKGLGGIGGFALVGLVSLHAGVPFVTAGMRALTGGIVGFAVAWFAAVQVWRHLAVAEIRRHQAEALARRRRLEEELEAARAQRESQPA